MSTFRQTVIKENLRQRAETIRAIRDFFIANGFLEVETPIRIPAPAPEAYIDALPSEGWFLHTSPELCMKRLLAAGCDKIFQLCRCFRAKERGKMHLPEFTILEWYCVGAGYLDMMKQCEELIRFVAAETGHGSSINYQGKLIELDGPWKRITVAEAFERYSSVTLKRALSEDLFDEIIDSEIERELGKDHPVFLYDYPASKAALARLKPDDNSLAERFELYIGGVELCNAFTELIDFEEQGRRFAEELSIRKKTGGALYPMPEKFLSSLKHMPDAAGNALGVDRLVMLLADTADIDDVIAFAPEEL